MGKSKKTDLNATAKRDSEELPSDEPNQYDEKTERLISKQATSALLYLLFYSILMFTLPFGAFYGTRHLLREHTDYSEFTITSLSVTSSVITVYIIIGLYAYKAYTEEDVIPSAKKSKKQK